MMKMVKKQFLLFLVAIILSGCISNSNNQLDIQPNIVLPPKDPTLQGLTISINSADLRQDKALAKVNRDGALVTLMPSRDLQFLLQEVLEKQMTARGYMIDPNGAANLQIVLNRLDTDIKEGNLRYNITTNADISIIAKANNGNRQVKTYRANYNQQGALTATNSKIAQAVNSAINDIVLNMSEDTSVNDFIKANARQ